MPTDKAGAPQDARASSTVDEKLNESEFLQEQAEAAKAAIAAAFADLKSDLGKGADPRIWMKSHPWITLASAAVAGFAAAASVVPSKEQQARHKLQAMERAMHARGDSSGNGHQGNEKRGFVTMILHELFHAIKPVVISLVTAHFTPPPEKHEEPDPPQSAP